MDDTLPLEEELNYLYWRQRQLEIVAIAMTLLHIIYFVERRREHRN